MKYIAQSNGSYAAYDETSDVYAALQALPEGRRPTFLPAASKEVKAYLAAQAEAAKPKHITARQAHEALIRKGMADSIRNAIAGIEDPVEQAIANNWFEKSNTFERDNATLKEVAGSIGLKANDIDNLFAYAATL
jgi:hypothetical protein